MYNCYKTDISSYEYFDISFLFARHQAGAYVSTVRIQRFVTALGVAYVL